MSVVIVVGVQWGDEGKGKIVDYLTENAKLVVRFQGGSNAGHTVIIEGKKTALRLIPSGILRPDTRCLLAAGVVLDPVALFEEMDSLAQVGVDVSPKRLGIAQEAQIVLPYHKAVDAAREAGLKDGKIGTTGKGIGPTYEDAVSRAGIRVADLLDHERLRVLVERNVIAKNAYLRDVLESDVAFEPEVLFQELVEVGKRLAPYAASVSEEVNRAIVDNRLIVFEGAQGCLLDVNHGTYPYVTSSNTLAGYACVSAGFGPKHVDHVLGICKAYCTRVGSGPFPTEEIGEIGDELRRIGREFGTVTGRPRRCGWFDAMAVRRVIRLNGIDSLVITKLDVLNTFETIRVGIGYTLDGEEIFDLPAQAKAMERVVARYEELPGWNCDISQAKRFEELPENAQKFILRLEKLVDCDIGAISVGPDRVQTIIRSSQLQTFAGD